MCIICMAYNNTRTIINNTKGNTCPYFKGSCCVRIEDAVLFTMREPLIWVCLMVNKSTPTYLIDGRQPSTTTVSRCCQIM